MYKVYNKSKRVCHVHSQYFFNQQLFYDLFKLAELYTSIIIRQFTMKTQIERLSKSQIILIQFNTSNIYQNPLSTDS